MHMYMCIMYMYNSGYSLPISDINPLVVAEYTSPLILCVYKGSIFINIIHYFYVTSAFTCVANQIVDMRDFL